MILPTIRKRTAVLAAAAVMAAATGIGLAWARTGDGTDHPESGREAPTAAGWFDEAKTAFVPLVTEAPRFVGAAYQWSTGTMADPQFADQLGSAAASFGLTRDRVAAVGPFPGAPVAFDRYANSVELYLASITVYRAALHSGDAQTRAEMDGLARRIRLLGDPLYDLGTDAISRTGELGAVRGEDLPIPVPVWAEEGLEPGPSLGHHPTAAPVPAGPWPVPADRTAWEEEVDAAAFPTEAELDRLLDAGSAGQLREAAQRLSAASDHLVGLSGPPAAPRQTKLLRVGLLVQAEAARTAAMATLLHLDGDGGPLGATARRLEEIGARLRTAALSGDPLHIAG